MRTNPEDMLPVDLSPLCPAPKPLNKGSDVFSIDGESAETPTLEDFQDSRFTESLFYLSVVTELSPCLSSQNCL